MVLVSIHETLDLINIEHVNEVISREFLYSWNFLSYILFKFDIFNEDTNEYNYYEKSKVFLIIKFKVSI